MSVSSITIEEWIYFEVLLRAESIVSVFKEKRINKELFMNVYNYWLCKIFSIKK